MTVRRSQGFSMVEMLIVISLLAIMVVIAGPYLMGQREKRQLMAERDELVNILKEAQNKSMVVEDGYAYGVVGVNTDGDPLTANEHRICWNGLADCGDKVYKVDGGVDVKWNGSSEVEFAKLNGAVVGIKTARVESNKFWAEIVLSEQGIIEVTGVEKI